eukprot:1083098-Amphidinium_carterae.1
MPRTKTGVGHEPKHDGVFRRSAYVIIYVGTVAKQASALVGRSIDMKKNPSYSVAHNLPSNPTKGAETPNPTKGAESLSKRSSCPCNC